MQSFPPFLLKFKWIRNPFYLTSIFISNPLLHVFSVETKIIVIVLFSGLLLPTFFPMARIFLLLLRFFVRRKKNRKSGCGRFPELHFPDLCQSRRCRLVDSDSSPALPYSVSAINEDLFNLIVPHNLMTSTVGRGSL